MTLPARYPCLCPTRREPAAASAPRGAAEAWDQVPKKIIIDAFRHCGISIKLDGTENHLAPEEEEEEMQAEGVREVAVATGLDVLYQETPNYRGAAAEADRMIEPRETAGECQTWVLGSLLLVQVRRS
ncbi:unnamed protein product [Closterium sp. Naga37s-1]|nr:unnamed protein product [Closterium sp. Naga37s-1]